MRREKGFVVGLVIGIAVFICIAGFLPGHAHATPPPNTDDSPVLYSSGSIANDGAYPLGSLTLSGSTFYGMTSGIGDYADSSGTIFKVNTDGTGYQMLYNFGDKTIADGVRERHVKVVDRGAVAGAALHKEEIIEKGVRQGVGARGRSLGFQGSFRAKIGESRSDHETPRLRA